jgi:catechol 2,3-dioxygenase-like lactoylglutathione lyase family enzyme
MITRRNLLLSLPAMAAASRATMAQSASPTIRLRAFNHVTIRVSDFKRSLDFYQGLFGMAIQGRQGATVSLRIGSGPQHIGMSAAGANEKVGIHHFCMTVDGFNVDGFNVDRILKILAARGVTPRGPADGAVAPLKSFVRMRHEAEGGGKEGTPELYFTDQDGILLQLQDASYCGGSGPLGNVCLAKLEPLPRKGLLAVRDLSHVTVNVSDQARALTFYQGLFAMPIQAHQGATPLLKIGPGRQFLALSGGRANGPARTLGPAHACLFVEGFQLDKVLKALADVGVKPAGDARGAVGPMMSYVRMRGEEAGGAKGGTPELYLSDPNGILLQLQDVSYCGGSGYLGEVC